jgi:hypothetical protein
MVTKGLQVVISYHTVVVPAGPCQYIGKALKNLYDAI